MSIDRHVFSEHSNVNVTTNTAGIMLEASDESTSGLIGYEIQI